MHNVADILPLQLAKLSRCNFASIRTDMQSSRKIVWQSCQSNNSARVGVRMGKRENEAKTVRHPLLQQHLRQVQLLYLYLVADWRLYLKDFVQTCRKYSSHIRKLFNKLNAAKKSEKMGKERRKPKAKSCSKPKGNFTSWAGGLARDWPKLFAPGHKFRLCALSLLLASVAIAVAVAVSAAFN